MTALPMRIGQGYDIHELVEGRPLAIGGVKVPFERGSLGHSDGDVLIHAVIDAILGALGLGDIGKHFPPSDDKYRDANSLDLLSEVAGMMAKAGYRIGNIDSTVIIEKPKLAPHMAAMKVALSKALDTPVGQISIKAKTAEGMGAVGEGRAVACHAVALLILAP